MLKPGLLVFWTALDRLGLHETTPRPDEIRPCDSQANAGADFQPFWSANTDEY